jgi:hypothetical protein
MSAVNALAFCQPPSTSLTEKLLPTNLPTANGSYSPFQRLGSPRENLSFAPTHKAFRRRSPFRFDPDQDSVLMAISVPF